MNVLDVVLAWERAVSSGDIETACALSDVNVEVGGPRGAGRGHPLVRDWMARTGITLERLRLFQRASVVVVEHRATWKLGDGSTTTKAVGTVFRVAGARVVSVIRYDSLEDALAAGGLAMRDEYMTLG